MKELGLYIHIPFCRSKCYYCDFYSVEKKDDMVLDKYIESIERETNYFLENFKITYPYITTIYIGGGTPSLLNEKQIESLFFMICKYFKIENLKEINIELNPESINENKLLEIKNLFFSISENVRLSLGVQSFNDEILKLIGRLHTKKDVMVAVELFRKLGFNNYNFDLIFGLPTQDVEDVMKDLNYALNLSPTHLSCYALEEKTYFKKCGYIPDYDLQYKMYELIVDFLTKNEYYIYEISNFAKKGYRCLHNLNYWKRKEYIGLGPSAVSFFSNKRIKNVSRIDDYINFNFKYEEENISYETAMKEKIMLALRTTDGLFLDNDIINRYKNQLDKLVKEKKLILENGYLKIPLEYMFLSNQILVEFM